MKVEKYRFIHTIQVRYADTDAQGHVYFSNYLTYFDEAHTAYLREIGFPWSKLVDTGLESYQVSAHCDFKGSAIFEDILHVHARIARIGESSYTINCAIYMKGSDELIAGGYITAVVVTPETRQPTRVPDEIRQAVAVYEGQPREQSEQDINPM
jgi:acyl-CoA thioester hydrolase